MGGVRTLGMMMMISLWWAPNFNFKISQYLHLMVTIFENEDATTRHAGEADGQTLAETAGSPGRNTSAGHMKLDNVFRICRHESRVAYSGRDQNEKCVFNESEWLMDKFKLDLSLVARLGGHSAPGFTVARNVSRA